MRLFNILETTFDNFDNTVRTYLSKTFDSLGLNYTSNQIFGVIYDGIKGVMQNVMFYIEDALTEQNIYTATRKRSFYSLAKLSGYEPYYGSAATGTATIKPVISNVPPTETTTKVFIRNHSVMIDADSGRSYTIMMPTDEYVIDITKPLVQHRVKIVQGIWTSTRFTATGENFETFQITNPALFDKQYVRVTVNGIEYKQVPCIYDMVENELGCVMTTGFDSSFEITFGNGAHGKATENGDSIVIEYIVHDGSIGNIVNAGNIHFTMVSPVYSINGNTLTASEYFTIGTDEPVTGGTDADTVDMVKKMIGYNSRSLVLASEDNYKQFLKRFSFIGRTAISADPSSMTITAMCMSNVIDKLSTPEDYLSINPDDLKLNDYQKEMVKTSLIKSDKIFAGVKFNFGDPVIRKFAAICYVKLDEGSIRDTITAVIRNTISEYFINLPENTTFIAKSDIIKTVLAADDRIKSFDIEFISDTAESAWYEGYWVKYVQRMVNGVYSYVPVKTIYDSSVIPCMDNFGNIMLDTTIEMPMLSGGFNIYDKNTGDSFRANTLDILFM